MINATTKDDGTVIQSEVSDNTIAKLLSSLDGKKAQDELHQTLKKYPNYLGYTHTHSPVKVGIKKSEKVITIYVSKKKALSELMSNDVLPEQINGVKTQVIQIGEVIGPRPIPPKGKGMKASTVSLADYTKRYRPIPNGVSIGNITITAGTVGGLVTCSGVNCLMTNTHVACQTIGADLGTQERRCAQPGPYDDSNYTPNIMGSTYKAIIMPAGQPAYNDLAIIRLDDQAGATGKTLDKGIMPTAVGTLAVGDRLWKEGRTTGFTFGTVVSIGSTITVGYGNDGSRDHRLCIVTTAMSAGGDSGSWVYKKVSPGDTITDADRVLVAYLFAGSSSNTILHDINNGLSALGATPVFDTAPVPPTKDIQVDAILTAVNPGGDTFRVFGTVADSKGAFIPGCVVTVTASSGVTASTKTATTDNMGNYSIDGLPYNQGYSFKVDFTAAGYNPYSYVIGVH